jgi:hypothetical protein
MKNTIIIILTLLASVASAYYLTGGFEIVGQKIVLITLAVSVLPILLIGGSVIFLKPTSKKSTKFILWIIILLSVLWIGYLFRMSGQSFCCGPSNLLDAPIIN